MAHTEGEQQLVPPTECEQDKIFFIFNTLRLMILAAKTNDLNEFLNIEENDMHARYLSPDTAVPRHLLNN